MDDNDQPEIPDGYVCILYNYCVQQDCWIQLQPLIDDKTWEVITTPTIFCQAGTMFISDGYMFVQWIRNVDNTLRISNQCTTEKG